MAQRFNLNVVQEYSQDGAQKKRYYRVGVAWLKDLPNGEQVLEIRIPDGISLSGELVGFTPRERTAAGG